MKYFTVKQLEDELGISGDRIRTLIKTGRLKASLVVKRYFVSEKNLDEFFNSNLKIIDHDD